MQQTLEQTIIINYGNTTDLGAPNTGTLSDTSILPIILVITIILLAASFYLINIRKSSRKSFRGFGIFTFLILSTFALTINLSTANAIPYLTLAANQNNLTVTVPQGGGTAAVSTTITTGTVNETGYKLTAALAQAEPGIDISLRGGDIGTNTPLIAHTTPLSLKTTTEANLDDATDTTEVTLTFAIDSTVTPGQKQLKLSYTATDNDPIPLASIQSFTASNCTALPIYDGTNEDAIVTRADSRGGITRTYRIAKLADENCWMLDNLKLGSTTSSITLTSSDSNIAPDTTFELPQLNDGARSSILSGPGNDYDTPYAHGPVTGDTGSGATNYGYLYNFSAATAGETRTSLPAGDDTAQYSICPANWRLPTGGVNDTIDRMPKDTSDFNILNARMAGFASTTDSTYLDNPWGYQANWLFNGQFRGIFSGGWGGGFVDQGSWGDLWSASAYPDSSDTAFSAYFGPDYVYPGSYNDGRDAGYGVRCMREPLRF